MSVTHLYIPVFSKWTTPSRAIIESTIEKLTYKFYKKTAIRNIVMLDFKYHLSTSELNGKCIHEY